MKNVDRMTLPLILGHKLNGEEFNADLQDLPHLLIGGLTGSGKSNLIINMVDEMAARKSPDEVRFLLIDPKMVEFTDLSARVAEYLYQPVSCSRATAYTIIDDAFSAVAELCKEMDSRYRLLTEQHCRSIEEYNRKNEEKLPYIIVVIDELADYFLLAPDYDDEDYDEDVDDCGDEVENPIADQEALSPLDTPITNLEILASMGRMVGIHLIMSTQRPSEDIVTGTMKALIPARIAFKVYNKKESRVLIERPGAELLKNPGDFIWSALGEWESVHAPLSKV